MTRKLRAVDVPQEPVNQSISAAARGSRLDLLRAVRDMIARELDNGVPARELASLTKRLADVSAEIEEAVAASGEVSSGGAADEVWRPEAI